MAQALPLVISGPVGVRLRAGRVAPAALSGGVTEDSDVSSGGLSSNAPPPPPGLTVATLTAYAAGAVTAPYSATLMPLRGTVPSGSTLRSTDDTTLRASILSTHDDGSAAVVVVSGSKTFAAGSSTISVQTSTASDTALTVAAISALVSSVSVAFDGGYGTASITNFASPERTWWANGSTICARYRVAAPIPGSTSLEAVIDIHAWSGRALVEIVIENGKMTTGGPGVATTKPTAASYSAAVVSVNGSTIATLNGNGAPEGNHAAFRALYASTWVGGNPGLRVTQLHTELQQHPLLFKCDQTNSADLSIYASDAYAAWGTGRHRATTMGGGGDHASIGPLPQWEARALQSGDYRTWQATEANALTLLGYGINYRDSSTGLPQTLTQLKANNVSQNGYSVGNAAYWPGTAYNGAMGWEVAHQPAAGLMAFVSRPSPVFIELSQKIAVENATYSVTTGGPVTATGVFANNYQTRGRAWCMRNLAQAIFLTPDGHAWKAPAKVSISDNVTWLDGYRTDSRAGLNLLWEYSPTNVGGSYSMGSAHGVAAWMHHYLVTEMHKVASARLLTGSDQTALNTLADWVASQPVKWVNEQSTTGAWRYIPYATAIGRTVNNIEPGQTYATQMDWWFTDTTPATVAGTWMGTNSEGTDTYAAFSAVTSPTGIYYPMYFWAALVAATERGVSGAVTAWNTVIANVTNLATWRAGFSTEPRWGCAPKSIGGFATGAGTGTFSAGVWTPARTGAVVNQASWDIVPSDQWVRVADTEMSTLTATIVAAGLNWNSTKLNWAGYTQSWSGWGVDLTGSRLWTFSGGHSDGNNNGLYRFDCFNMAWAIEKLPTDRLVQDGEYATTFGGNAGQGTYNYAARDSARAKFSGAGLGFINDDWYDQFLSDSNPTARHSYSSLIYDAARDCVYMPNRRWWQFNRATATWDYRRIFNDNPHVLAANAEGFNSLMSSEHVISAWDEATGKALVSATGSFGTQTLAYAPSTATFSAVSLPWAGWGNACDTRHGRYVAVVSPPSAGGPFIGKYWRYNLDTSSTGGVQGDLQFSGGITQADFYADAFGHDGCSLTYVEPLGKYLMVAPRASDRRMSFYWIDPTTTPWTCSPATLTNAPTTLSLLLNRRMEYMPGLRAIIMQDLGSTQLYLYKVA